MKSLLSTCLLVAAAITAQAQLVGSLNFSTGHDNTTGSALTLGAQDPDWRIIALSAPLTPVGSFPYNSYTQTPWGPGPVTPANTLWISYDNVGMTLFAPPDYNGTGRTTYEYSFETCGEDQIRISATIRGDNVVTAVRVDGVNTGFSQTGISNWVTGTALSYATTMTSGVHVIEVDVENTPGIGPSNPTGLNVDGVITSTNSRIIDRSNFPDYACCNAYFRYCINVMNPYRLNFTAADSSQPGNYNWYIDGTYIGSGPTLSYGFAAPGSYQVCMTYANEEGEVCEQCIIICIADNPVEQGRSKMSKSGLSINAVSRSFGIDKVYPNPASAEVNIELRSAASNTPVSVKLYDVMGKVVSENSITLPQGQKKLSISTSQLPEGIYSLHVSDGVTIIVEKIQIEK